MSINKENIKNLVLPEIPKEEKIMSSTQKSKKGQGRNAPDKNWIHPFKR
jgi:hypothetical protein